jgi:NAD(P)-dependent dehydrogenase (short-subunit alcohol dehydrogenase family)
VLQESDVVQRLFSLNGKTALVTGSSGGIGRALAVGLAGAGAVVGLHGRSAEQLEITRQLIEANGGQAVLLPADLKTVAACRKLIADSVTSLGRLDVLVNCAGINQRNPIEQVTEEDFATILDVNLRAVYFLSQAVHPIMRKQGGGKIIHVASLASFMGLATSGVYGITKAALAQLAKTQAVEWARDNIQVNCLAPGFIKTPLTEKSLWGDDTRRAWMLGRTPAKRAGRPEDLVGAVLYMAGQGSDFLTGQIIAVDGGVLAGGSWDE